MNRIYFIIGITVAFLGSQLFDIYHLIDNTNWNIFYFVMGFAGWIIAAKPYFDKRFPETNIYLIVILGAFLYKIYQELSKINWPFNEYSKAINDPVVNYILIAWIIGCLIFLIGYVKWKK
jgi:hypothetical protein